MLFKPIEDLWSQTLTYEGGAEWADYSYTEGGLPMADTPQVANNVPVKPWHKSKILWTAVGSVAVYIITELVNMSPDDKAKLIAAYGVIQNVAVGAFRIWANDTVSPGFK